MLQAVTQDSNKVSLVEHSAENSRLSGLIVTPGTQTKDKHAAI